MTASPRTLDGRRALVTGAASGIGAACARALAEAGARVIAADVDAAGAARIAEEIGGEPWTVDLADTRALEDLVLDVDVLVNNAGLVQSVRSETVDGFEATFGINHLGPFLLTRLLTERLVRSAPARVVNVASTAHQAARHGLDFDDLQTTRHYRGMQAYGRSKLANILFTTELARRLSGTGVTANCLHPGTVATGFARDDDAKGFLAFGVKLIKPFILTPEQGARTSVYLASSPDVADVTGQYFVKCRVRTPSPAAQDQAAALLLWSVSEELVDRAGSGSPAR